MTFALLAQVAPVRSGWSFGEVLIAIVVVLACIAVVWVGTQAMGITIPQWLVRILAICIIAVVVIFAIKFLLSV